MDLKDIFNAGLVWRSSSRSPLSVNPHLRSAVFGVPEIDSQLPYGGLPFGCVHECALANRLPAAQMWYAPLLIVASLLGSTIASLRQKTMLPPEKKIIAWVGRKSWPTPHVLQEALNKICLDKGEEDWSSNCMFINPPNKNKRLWTVTQLLRSPAVLAVVAEGSGFEMKATRRLQLAAKRGGALGIIIRPPAEISSPTAAQTKWIFTPVPAEDGALRWSIELLRAKGLALPDVQDGARYRPGKWLIEWNKEDGKNSLRLVVDEQAGASRRMA